MRIAFLVTHLLGTGHLARTARLADAFAQAGHDAVVLSGGMPAPLAAPKIARLQQLAPVRSDEAFTALFDPDGTVIDDAYLAARIADIREALSSFDPHVLVTELFPFGRRKLAAEFEAAIGAADGALVLSSIRDILQRPRKPGRQEEAEERLARLYDGVLFHGDAALADLGASWPLPPALRPMVKATGFIGEANALEPTGDSDGVVVAAGGGAVGDALFAASLDAARTMPGRRWRLLVGGADREMRVARMGTPPANAVIEPTRPDFRALLAGCGVAVLQCGYNTAMDVIATGARAVFCPFEGTGETEQLQRARAMAERYGCGVLRETDLSAAALADAVESAMRGPKPDYAGLRLDGAENSVGIVEAMLEARG